MDGLDRLVHDEIEAECSADGVFSLKQLRAPSSITLGQPLDISLVRTRQIEL